MSPENLGYAEAEMQMPLHAAGLFTDRFTGTMPDGTEELLLAFGIATNDGTKEVHVLALAPVEIAATIVAAIRESARHNGVSAQLNAAIDQREMMWRNL